MKKNGKWIFTLILIIAVVSVFPLFLSTFDTAGTDDDAGKAVAAIDPDYEPWVKSVARIPGVHTETLLFCIQAGIGAGVLGSGFGYLIIRKKNQKGND